MPGVGPAYGAFVAVWAPAGGIPPGGTTAGGRGAAAGNPPLPGNLPLPAPTPTPPLGATTAVSRATAARNLRIPEHFAVRAPTPTSRRGSGVLADVLVPQLRVRRDELRHQRHAVEVAGHDDVDATAAQQVLGAHERAVLPHHDPRDAVEQDRAGAHVARREGGVHRRGPVDPRMQPAGVLQRVGLPVPDRAALLDAAVVTGTEHATVGDEHGADRDTAFVAAGPGLRDRSVEPATVLRCQRARSVRVTANSSA